MGVKKLQKEEKKKNVQRRVKAEEERNYDVVSRKREEKGTFVKAFLRFLFSQVGLVILCIVIAIGGAEIFRILERDNEAAKVKKMVVKAEEVDDAQNYMSNALYWYVHDEEKNYTETQFMSTVELRLNEFISFIVNATEQVKYAGSADNWDEQWTFPNALLFTISIMTLIGYGNVSPETTSGQMFCIGYAILAIGTTLVMLANVGSGLAKGLIYTYSRCCCRWFRSQRLNSEIPSRTLRKKLKRRLIDEEVGEELYMSTSTITIPIIVNIVLIFGYIFLGALIFKAWEGWDFVTAVYFSFITLSTIGFGDETPTKTFHAIAKPNANFSDNIKVVIAILYCSLGLAILSLCVSLIQEQISMKAARVLHGKEEKIEMDKVQVVERKANVMDGFDVAVPVVATAALVGAAAAAQEGEDEGSSPVDVEEGGGGSRPGSGTSSIPGEAEEDEEEEEEDDDDDEGDDDDEENEDDEE